MTQKRVYAGVNTMMESASPMKKKLMKKSLELGRVKSKSYDGNNELPLFQELGYKILDNMVLKKIRDRFGGNLRHGFCAGAGKEIFSYQLYRKR